MTRRGEPVAADVVSLSHEGRGIARPGGKTVFIDNALTGESILFRYFRHRASFDEGVAIEIRNPSPARAEPVCRHYSVCGGCSLQHLRPDEQVRHKESVLLEQLHAIAGIEPRESLPPISGPTEGYRRRARLGVRFVHARGRALVGFHEKRSSRVADIDSCEVLHPEAARLLAPLSTLIGTLDHPETFPQVELAIGENGSAFILRHLRELPERDLERLREFERTQGVRVFLQPGGDDSVHSLIPGADRPLSYRLPQHDVEIFFEPTDFTQVNFDVNRALVGRVIELLAPGSAEQVLDLYCGLGNFSLPLARRAAQVIGIEGSKPLVAGAQRNAAHNRIANVEFQCADLASESAPHAFLQRRYVKVSLDPPRAGALEILRRLDLSGTSRIAYVSCNPATLARDARLLTGAPGFILDKAGVIDMFPHTSHSETLAIFERA
ncbi:MAG: 23S rRNA (uracil(1939)-C(5))-methyltransferase RlmD [Gammaproteobacteria bacterium]|nr:23S rRNA (uracil(1939)-C(5))-methyltransferase RlmD [Gammaproteobacteria bacterium]